VLFFSAPVFLIMLAAGSVLVLLPGAYPRPGIYQPTGLTPTCARFSDGLLLDGFSTADRAAPGEILEVSLSAYGMASRPGSGILAVELRGDQGALWGTAETAVSWTPGETIAASLPLPVSDEVTPGRATLFAGLRNAAGGWQAAASANARDLTVPLALRTVKIPQPEGVMGQPQTAVTADLGGQMRLLGYDLQRNGAAVKVTLFWEALAPMDDDFTTFVHLLDAGGRLLAQVDGQPQDGRYPTVIWDAGEVVLDPKVLALPVENAEGPLALVAGAYRLPGGERLALDSGADGIPLATFETLDQLRAGVERP
jgi:hypothetical protein